MAPRTVYRRLDPAQITKTLEVLLLRIEERFPGSGLANVCKDLVALARDTAARSEKVARSNLALKALIWLAIAAGVLLLVAVAQLIFTSTKTNDDLFGTLQGIDSGFNIIVLMGATLFFVSTLELRLKQRLALKALHEFRSIVHVIDMHQLTKDPSMLGAVHTSSSPDRGLTPFELMRYLDYCSEMLSLIGQTCRTLRREAERSGSRRYGRRHRTADVRSFRQDLAEDHDRAEPRRPRHAAAGGE